MTTATLTSKHQITLPQPVLQALGAQANALIAECAVAAGRHRTVTLDNAAAKAGMSAFR